jgi:ornithine cyclodeaminase
VGACIPVARELDTEAVRRSRLFVDSRESAMNEAGDLLIPMRAGVIDESHIVGELGEVLLGRIEGCRGDDEITLFKSLGLAVEDLAAARHILGKARLSQRGIEVTIGALRHEAP